MKYKGDTNLVNCERKATYTQSNPLSNVMARPILSPGQLTLQQEQNYTTEKEVVPNLAPVQSNAEGEGDEWVDCEVDEVEQGRTEAYDNLAPAPPDPTDTVTPGSSVKGPQAPAWSPLILKRPRRTKNKVDYKKYL